MILDKLLRSLDTARPKQRRAVQFQGSSLLQKAIRVLKQTKELHIKKTYQCHKVNNSVKQNKTAGKISCNLQFNQTKFMLQIIHSSTSTALQPPFHHPSTPQVKLQRSSNTTRISFPQPNKHQTLNSCKQYSPKTSSSAIQALAKKNLK